MSNINQFAIESAIGELDLSFFGCENIVSCRYNPNATSTNRLIPGESVMLKDLSTADTVGAPIVDERAAEHTSTIFGTVVKATNKKEYKPGDIVQIAVAGAVIRLKASGALARGVAVTPVLATPGSVKAVSTKTHYGITLDNIADGAIGRVLIQANGVAVGSA